MVLVRAEITVGARSITQVRRVDQITFGQIQTRFACAPRSTASAMDGMAADRAALASRLPAGTRRW